MAFAGRIRDNSLLDALEKLAPVRFSGKVWRVVRLGRDALTASSAGGRWDDGTFDVLYTSQLADGVIAEMLFHLSRGQPVFPSRVRYGLHELQASLERARHLVDVAAIARLGVDTTHYGQLSYADRQQEYPRTQEVAEAAHFIGYDGLIVPNARWACSNVVLFRTTPDAIDVVRDHGLVDWGAWLKKPLGY
jgi:RES domain-containing protein